MRTALLLLLLAGPEADIDSAISARHGGPASPRAGDAEFLRRVWLDLAGTIPTAAEARAFLAHPDRPKLIDRLLDSPDYPRRMAEAWTVMLLERRTGKAVPDRQWLDYLQKSFAANEPWNKVVRTLLLADGRKPETRGAMKLLADGSSGDQHRMTQDVSRLFLGRDIRCAQCHDHPSIKDYTQADYMGLFAFLHPSTLQDDPRIKQPVLVEGLMNGKVEFASVFSPAKKNAVGPRLPGGKEIEIPKYDKGQEFEVPPVKGGSPGVPKFRPRERLAEELTAEENRAFARTSVNRFWFLLLGRGLVHPLDLDHKGNPPSHPELFEALTDAFVKEGYDVKKLLRRIARSEAYQRSSRLPSGERSVPPASYRAALLKPLSAEQMAWAVLRATGNLESLLQAKGESKFSAKDYIAGKSAAPPRTLDDALRFFAEIFGNAAGEPEVEFQPSMTHALFLMNEKLVLEWLMPRPGNLVDRLSRLPDAEAAEELFLSVLTRLPDPEERAEMAAYLARHAGRRAAALGELAWALLASAEFRLNH